MGGGEVSELYGKSGAIFSGVRDAAFEFHDEVLVIINRERFYHPDPNVQRRMEVLWLKAQGETHERIATLSGGCRRTVQRILGLFWEGGLVAVRQFHWHQPSSALAPHRQRLEAAFRERPPHTVAEACDRIEPLTGIGKET